MILNFICFVLVSSLASSIPPLLIKFQFLMLTAISRLTNSSQGGDTDLSYLCWNTSRICYGDMLL